MARKVVARTPQSFKVAKKVKKKPTSEKTKKACALKLGGDEIGERSNYQFEDPVVSAAVPDSAGERKHSGSIEPPTKTICGGEHYHSEKGRPKIGPRRSPRVSLWTSSKTSPRGSPSPNPTTRRLGLVQHATSAIVASVVPLNTCKRYPCRCPSGVAKTSVTGQDQTHAQAAQERLQAQSGKVMSRSESVDWLLDHMDRDHIEGFMDLLKYHKED